MESQSFGRHTRHIKNHTIVTPVSIYQVSVIDALEGLLHVPVKFEVIRVIFRPNVLQIFEQVPVHVFMIGLRRLQLIACRCMESQRLGDDIKNLTSIDVSLSKGRDKRQVDHRHFPVSFCRKELRTYMPEHPWATPTALLRPSSTDQSIERWQRNLSKRNMRQVNTETSASCTCEV